MRKMLVLLPVVCLIATCLLTGCNKSQPASTPAAPAAASTTSSDDPVQKKLQELAGAAMTNCGIVKSQAPAELDAAGKCAMDAAKARSPFFVEYQMPGMNVAVAGNAQGKLYSVQSQEGGAGLTSADCPNELRVAPSGRVTCYAPGTFPMGAGAGSHSTMSMPPAMGKSASNPHGNPPPKP
jgi:hypothetical protein